MPLATHKKIWGSFVWEFFLAIGEQGNIDRKNLSPAWFNIDQVAHLLSILGCFVPNAKPQSTIAAKHSSTKVPGFAVAAFNGRLHWAFLLLLVCHIPPVKQTRFLFTGQNGAPTKEDENAKGEVISNQIQIIKPCSGAMWTSSVLLKFFGMHRDRPSWCQCVIERWWRIKLWICCKENARKTLVLTQLTHFDHQLSNLCM